MTIQEFIEQAHSETLNFIEKNLMEQLIVLDRYYQLGTIHKHRHNRPIAQKPFCLQK